MPADNRQTQSLCPICLARIPAERVFLEDIVYLEKTCPEHGHFKTKIWQGSPDYLKWPRPRTLPVLPVGQRPGDRGCPFDCGLCVDHRQYGCTVLLEITHRCNLLCPVCFADAGIKTGPDPSMQQIDQWYRIASSSENECVIQLSGGEPSLRDDLPEIVKRGHRYGFDFIQLNTNGLRLAADKPFVQKLAQAGLSSVFLQFDGVSDNAYRQIRGRELFDIKCRAIEVCAENGIGVILVPTLIAGVNTDQIGPIIRFALDKMPAVRGVHLQPVSYFGRYPGQPADNNRFTLPELMLAIEKQTAGLFKKSSFQPPSCENAYCSFHCSFIRLKNGKILPVSRTTDNSCCSRISPDKGHVSQAVSSVSRQWSAPLSPKKKTADQSSCCCCGDASNLADRNEPLQLDEFLEMANNNSFSISAMAFQDVWNLDLDRVRECCIHVMSPDNRLIPFCLYNLTGQTGRSLYRK